MAATDHGPCWPPIDTSCCPVWEDADPALQDLAASIATRTLWALSGRRFGLCDLTVRPCGARCDEVTTYSGRGGQVGPVLIGGGIWIDISCGSCPPRPCSCAAPCEIVLPGPVQDIVEVIVDGLVVPASAYRVDDHRLLVRDDDECWPRCQNLGLPAGEEDTFTVTYTRGLPVPEGGLHAAGLYACEIVKACLDRPCELPQRVTSIVREGVTLALLDPMDMIEKGLTGVYLVDMWLHSENPYRVPFGAAVLSPDLRGPRTTTS